MTDTAEYPHAPNLTYFTMFSRPIGYCGSLATDSPRIIPSILCNFMATDEARAAYTALTRPSPSALPATPPIELNNSYAIAHAFIASLLFGLVIMRNNYFGFFRQIPKRNVRVERVIELFASYIPLSLLIIYAFLKGLYTVTHSILATLTILLMPLQSILVGRMTSEGEIVQRGVRLAVNGLVTGVYVACVASGGSTIRIVTIAIGVPFAFIILLGLPYYMTRRREEIDGKRGTVALAAPVPVLPFYTNAYYYPQTV